VSAVSAVDSWYRISGTNDHVKLIEGLDEFGDSDSGARPVVAYIAQDCRGQLLVVAREDLRERSYPDGCLILGENVVDDISQRIVCFTCSHSSRCVRMSIPQDKEQS
jgi:hypothetical protein